MSWCFISLPVPQCLCWSNRLTGLTLNNNSIIFGLIGICLLLIFAIDSVNKCGMTGIEVFSTSRWSRLPSRLVWRFTFVVIRSHLSIFGCDAETFAGILCPCFLNITCDHEIPNSCNDKFLGLYDQKCQKSDLTSVNLFPFIILLNLPGLPAWDTRFTTD